MSLLAIMSAEPPPDFLVEPVDPRPAPADATIASIRPIGRAIGTLTVGPDGDHATIGAAITAAQALQSSRAIAEGVPFLPNDGHPDFRVDIVIAAGTYPEAVTTSRDIALYGDGEVIVTGVALALGCLISNGGEYVEGITFRRDVISGVASGDLPKYPQHHAVNTTRQSIFADCTFHTQVEGGGGGWTGIGMDGNSGGRALWYGCTLSSANATTGVNLHGHAGTTAPGVYMLIGMQAPTAPLGYNSLHASQADELWVVGGTCTGITTAGAGTVLHYDPTSTTGTVTASGPSDTNTNWPVPTGGINAAERARYYPYA